MIDFSEVVIVPNVDPRKGYLVYDRGRLLLEVRFAKRAFQDNFSVEILDCLGEKPRTLWTIPNHIWNASGSETVLDLLESLVCPFCEQDWGEICPSCVDRAMQELAVTVQEMEEEYG